MKILATTDVHRGFNAKTHKIHDRFFKKIKEEIIQHQVDAVMIAGDIASDEVKEFESFFKAFRLINPDILTLFVLGNHDYWDVGWKFPKKARLSKMSIAEMDDFRFEMCRKYNIRWLQNNPYLFNNEVLICGFDGWYGNNPASVTNDGNYMPRMHESAPIYSYMSWRAFTSLDGILQQVEDPQCKFKKVCMTHFSLNPDPLNTTDILMSGSPSYFQFIIDNFDLFIYGHTHRFEDKMYGKCRVVNPGTGYNTVSHGYNSPQSIILEI